MKMIWWYILALLIGGFAPLIMGIARGKILIGILAFIVCIVVSLFTMWVGGLVVALVFVYYIGNQTANANQAAT
ncbi:hypothetical protein [Methanoculleus sp.]|uniref:hypothetical protein n=1 Tax=Methanoculleus sp. TaxID=90427 RepID=UPI0026327DA0|nr:hypothetical protein [Methanoculleus sp.]MDI6867879.1 hypothetical protein [Methanoculleus sp.]